MNSSGDSAPMWYALENGSREYKEKIWKEIKETNETKDNSSQSS